MKRIVFLSTICLLLSTFLLSCGYTTHSAYLSAFGINSVYVKPFVNKIDLTKETEEYRRLRVYFPLLETNITRKVVERFIFDGALRVVKEDKADVILEGELLEYRRDPLRYTVNDEDVEEYRISLIVKIALWDVKRKRYLWKEDWFVGDTTYFTQGSLSKTEEQALDDAVVDLARRVVERTVEAW